MTLDHLRALIHASGLPVSAFALVVLGRSPRTVQRWLAGETMPDTVARYLDALESVTRDDWGRYHVVTKRNPRVYHRKDHD
jgi:hypothetical protein